jgi:hypothetical protein
MYGAFGLPTISPCAWFSSMRTTMWSGRGTEAWGVAALAVDVVTVVTAVVAMSANAQDAARRASDMGMLAPALGDHGVKSNGFSSRGFRIATLVEESRRNNESSPAVKPVLTSNSMCVRG